MLRTARRHHNAPSFLVIALATVAAFLVQVGSAAPAGATELVDGDIIAPQPYAPAELFEAPRATALDAGDPLNLVLYPNELRRYSLGRDVFEVWECPDAGALPTTAAQFAADAEANVSPYFVWLSGGRYDPDFIVGGTVPAGRDCSSWARNNATGRATGALFIRATTGGYAGPGYWCLSGSYTCPTTYPENIREGFIGVSGRSWTTLAHEMGHMLSWAHSSAGYSDYDNAIDLMSGNYGVWRSGSYTRWGTYPEPYATVGINRYGAGWIDTTDVVMWDGTDTTVTITAGAGYSDQLLVIDSGSSYFTFDLRVSQRLDPIPSAWTGVEVYEITRCADCWGLYSEITPTPAIPFSFSDLSAYSRPLPHVLVPGDSIGVGSTTVTLLSRVGDTATLQIGAGGPPPPDQPPPADEPPPAPGVTTRFRDVPTSHTFYTEIEWLAARTITRGCNPPAGDLFCPDTTVTRGQMAAFLARALDLPATSTDYFTDDDGSIFENDINRLAASGITKGCNPTEGNTRYCPGTTVTRGQMAAFLARALG